MMDPNKVDKESRWETHYDLPIILPSLQTIIIICTSLPNIYKITRDPAGIVKLNE